MVGNKSLFFLFPATTAPNNTLLATFDSDVSVKAVSITAKGGTAVTSVSGVRGLAKNFDGTANYLCTGTIANTCADNANLTITTGTFSLGFWIKTTSAVTTRTIVDKQVPPVTSAGYAVQINASHQLLSTVTDGTNAI